MKLAKQEDLQALGRILQQRLQTELPHADALKVGCALGDDGALVILSQHPPQINLDSDKTFAAIGQALQSLRPQAVQSVRLYLREAGQKQTYAQHDLILEPVEFAPIPEVEPSQTAAAIATEQASSPESELSPPQVVVEQPEPIPSVDPLTENHSTVTEAPPEPEPAPPAVVEQPEPIYENAAESTALRSTKAVESEPSSTELPTETWRSPPFKPQLETVAKTEPDPQAESQTGINTATLPHPALPLQRLPKPAKSKIPRAAFIAGSGVVIAALLGGVYVLSSPCTIGRCQQLETAKQLHQAAERMTQAAKERSELIDAEKQLEDANKLLKQIPPWSSRHQEARNLSGTIVTQAAILDRTVAAIEEGDTAANKLRQPIRSLEDWRAIQALWQRAILSLSNIPKDSNLYPLANRKITEYRGSLQAVERQMQAERQAFQRLTQAQNLAQTAQQRQRTAQSLQVWQAVRTDWQDAVNALSAIEQTSTAYQQAQQLLAQYRPQLKAASDRVAKEAVSAKAFSQAMNFAELAARNEQQRQFTLAQTNWKQALNFAKQIPNDTQYYNQARSAIETYTKKIEQPGGLLPGANITQKTRTDLDRTCSGKIRVCRYTLDNKQILVRLTSSYEQAVEKTFINARLRGDSKTQADIAAQYRTLKKALEAISDNTRIPLLIYGSDGEQMHSYKPKGVGSGE